MHVTTDAAVCVRAHQHVHCGAQRSEKEVGLCISGIQNAYRGCLSEERNRYRILVEVNTGARSVSPGGPRRVPSRVTLRVLLQVPPRVPPRCVR